MKLTYYIIIVVLSLSKTVYAQVSVGNKNPRGLLDVNDNPDDNATMGLVIPHTADVTAIVDPSASNEVSEVSGTVVFDIAHDCVRFIKNEGNWSECIAFWDDRGVGRGTFTPLRFKAIDHDNLVKIFAVGLTTNKRIFIWGFRNSVLNDIRKTPERITNIPGDPLIDKAFKSGDGIIMLSHQSEVYVVGVNENNQFGSQFPTGSVINPPVKLTLPAGETTAIDIASKSTIGPDTESPSFGTFIIGGSGKAYFSGAVNYSPARINGNIVTQNIDKYTQIPFPQGVDEQSFGYTKVFVDREDMFFFEGNDGNYYGSGTNTYGSLGNGSIVTTRIHSAINNPFTEATFVRVTDPPERVLFPNGTRIKKFYFSFVSVASRSVIAVAEDGNIYCMGFIGRAEDAKYIVAPIAESHINQIDSIITVTASLTNVGRLANSYYSSIPLPLSKPEGVNNFVDAGIIAHSIFVLADNDSVYFHSSTVTPGSYAVTKINPAVNKVRNQNKWKWVSNYLSTLNLGKLASMHSIHSGTAFALDKDGKVYYWGHAGTNAYLAGTLSGATQRYIVPTELVDGRLDPDNKAPE